ncbi:MAG: 3-methyl-2-oxobutanoate hydroxymethyltransferase [Gammaproteobacteria bacterium]
MKKISPKTQQKRSPKISVTRLRQMKKEGEKIAVLTSYDATFSVLLDDAGIDVQLVGDSLGMVIHGQDSTVSVTLEDMIYHSSIVSQTNKRSLIIADMPFMSYATPEQAMTNAARLMSEGGAEVIKMEGGAWLEETITLLSSRGIPVCAHLGLLPQSVHKLGGYRVQGRDKASAKQILKDAKTLEKAGAEMMVIELVTRELAAEISQAVSIPVIGIGAGADCDGQVLVLHDMLGVGGRYMKMCKNFMANSDSIQDAIKNYVDEVKAGTFPAEEHGFD